MPIVASFSITPLSDPSSFLISDTSTGSDGAITDRTITLYKTDNSIFGTFDFPLSAGSSITISPLIQDIALNVVLNWNNNVGTSLYNYSVIYAFVQYGLDFLENLTTFQISNPAIVDDQSWYQNKQQIFTEINSAQNAINVGQSLFRAQSCILRYQWIIKNANFYL